MKRIASLGFILVIFTACAAVDRAEKPAVFPVYSPENHDALKNALHALTGIRQSSLGRNAFVESNRLALQKTVGKNAAHSQGRIIEPPIVIYLFKRGNLCLLRNGKDKKEVVLKGVDCVVLVREKNNKY